MGIFKFKDFLMLPVFTKLTPAQEGAIRAEVANLNLQPSRIHLGQCQQAWMGFCNALQNGNVTIPGINGDVLLSFANPLGQQRAIVCEWCGGRGHETKDCMTNILLTRTARNAGLGFHWGAIKGMAYYRAD